jgi:hypothetical protein
MRLIIGFSLAILLMLTISSLNQSAEASTTEDLQAELVAYKWTILAGDDLLNDPMTAKILENIEISKKRIAELQNPQVQLTEQQKFVEQQRQIANAKLQEDLDRMYKKYEDFTPRAAFAKYVDEKPEMYHDFYWELFEYMEQKVIVARQARDQILENGGSRQQAQNAFNTLAKIPKAERFNLVNELNVKYGLLNKISSVEDFKELPPETQSAYSKYVAFNQPKSSSLVKSSEAKLPTDSMSSVELVSFSSPLVVDQEYVEYSNVKKQNNVKPQSKTVINLNRNFYETNGINSLDSVSSFTLSAWVKPDYSDGSSQLTILSKENEFSLTINNNIWPKQVVRFSVFDGIKWTMIESSSTIQEKWTHVAVTIDGSSLNLYINGELEGTKQIQSIPGISKNGFVSVQSIENIASDDQILIGAQQSTDRGLFKTMGFFSGQLDEIVIEEELFDEQKIHDLCNQSPYYSS